MIPIHAALTYIYNLVYNTFLHNQNQFASGGILLMAIGAIGAYLRKVPQDIWDWIVRQTTVTMMINDDQKAYFWVKDWMESQRIMKRTRRLDVFNRGPEKYIMVPAPGHHWMLYKGNILSVTVVRSEEKKQAGVGYGGTFQRSESILFKRLGRSQKLFREMMEEIYKNFEKQVEKKPTLYCWGAWGEWKEVSAFSPRSLDSVILPKVDKDRVVAEIEHFRNNRVWYGRMGIPYRKGIKFEGPPGTGKTSLVAGLASHFNSNVYILKLGDMTDSALMHAVSDVSPNSFLILEDIDGIKQALDRDKVGPESSQEEKKGVTLSGLLNVIDGMLSPSGAIFILTTNHPEKLDPALVRPGRIDLTLHIGYANLSQKKEMYSRFFEDEMPKEYEEAQMTMADLQQKLIERKQG